MEATELTTFYPLNQNMFTPQNKAKTKNNSLLEKKGFKERKRKN